MWKATKGCGVTPRLDERWILFFWICFYRWSEVCDGVLSVNWRYYSDKSAQKKTEARAALESGDRTTSRGVGKTTSISRIFLMTG
jgi:hypothetical protein